jgi:seryl-tRNA synthetase
MEKPDYRGLAKGKATAESPQQREALLAGHMRATARVLEEDIRRTQAELQSIEAKRNEVAQKLQILMARMSTVNALFRFAGPAPPTA